MSQTNDKNEPKYFRNIVHVLTPILVLLLGFVLVYRYEVQNQKANTKLVEITTEIAKLELASKGKKDAVEIKKSETQIEESQALTRLNELKESIMKLDLNVKEYRDRLYIENQEVTKNLNKLEVEVKQIRDKLDITSKQVKISSEAMQIVENIIPKMVFFLDGEKIQFDSVKRKVTVFFDLENRGKYGCFLDEPTIKLSRVKVKKDGALEFENELLVGKDYSLDYTYRWFGYYPSGWKHPLNITVKLNKWPSGETLQLEVSVNFRTDEKVVKSIRDYVGDFIPKETFSDLVKCDSSYTVDLDF